MKYNAIVRNFYGQSALMNGALTDRDIYEQFFDFINLQKNINAPVPLTEQGKKLLTHLIRINVPCRFKIFPSNVLPIAIHI